MRWQQALIKEAALQSTNSDIESLSHLLDVTETTMTHGQTHSTVVHLVPGVCILLLNTQALVTNLYDVLCATSGS
jgi:hypothetical protein